MTISTTIRTNQYNGNNSTTVFAYAFNIQADSELEVYLGTPVGAPTTWTRKTLTTHYTVSNAGVAGGGNVTFTSGNTPPTGVGNVFIRRVTPKTQATDYVENDPFPANSQENALDKLTQVTQDMQEEIDRCFKLGSIVPDAGETEASSVVADRKNKLFAFDNDGDFSVTSEIGNVQGNWAASTAYVLRDIVKDTSNNNIYICIEAHTSSGSQPISTNTDAAKWFLLVDAASATTSSTLASNWAKKTDGTVADSEFSSKAYAVGGTGVTNTSGKGAAKEWATKAEDSTVDTSGYSALHHAAKASASASAASSSSSSATTAKNAAETAETNAETAQAASEAAAGATAFKFTFDNSTTMADPGTGELRMNHGTVGSVSAIAFDAVSADSGNPDVSDFIASWDDGDNSTHEGYITIRKSGTPATFAVFSLTGAVTDNTGWLQAVTTHVDSNGSWTNGDTMYVSFARSGQVGATGSTGSTGPRGSDAGLDMTFESTTTDTDQGVGKIWFNHGTLSSATVLYMDDVDANSANINSLVDSWDDSTTTTLRGTIKVTQQASAAVFAIYNVTGAVTSASTYSKVAVTYVTGAGSFSDGDACNVDFSRTGNTGSAGSTTPADNEFRIQDNSDNTKQIAFEASSIASGTTRTITVPNNDVTLVSSGSIANADIDGSAAIATSKLSGAVTSIPSHGLGALATLGSVDTGQIAANAVGLAQMAGNTDGVIITFDASGDPVAVGPGTDGQVLTSTGAGSPPAFEDGGVAGISSSANATAISISSDEEVTMPLQPCFLACLSANASNVTGSGTQYSTAGKTFTEIYDIGSNFSSGTFTAPVTGKYILYGSFYFANTNTNNNQTIVYMTTSNRSYNSHRSHGYNIYPYQGNFTASVVADMDASDTFHMTVNMYGHSSDTVHVYGTGTPQNGTFMGASLIA